MYVYPAPRAAPDCFDAATAIPAYTDIWKARVARMLAARIASQHTREREIEEKRDENREKCAQHTRRYTGNRFGRARSSKRASEQARVGKIEIKKSRTKFSRRARVLWRGRERLKSRFQRRRGGRFLRTDLCAHACRTKREMSVTSQRGRVFALVRKLEKE